MFSQLVEIGLQRKYDLQTPAEIFSTGEEEQKERREIVNKVTNELIDYLVKHAGLNKYKGKRFDCCSRGRQERRMISSLVRLFLANLL